MVEALTAARLEEGTSGLSQHDLPEQCKVPSQEVSGLMRVAFGNSPSSASAGDTIRETLAETMCAAAHSRN